MNVIKSGDTACTMYILENAVDIATMAASMYDVDNAKIWLNLTNGIEIAPWLDKLHVPYDFCRFRSCSFEQKRWGDAIDSIPDDMLVRLALGQKQVIVDFGANKPCSRAMRQGIPIALRRIALSWGFDINKHMFMFSRNGKLIQCDDDFTKCAMNIDKRQRARLDYFGKYINDNTKLLAIDMLCAPTSHDGDYDYYINKLKGIYDT